jgi:diguanylate cyclase
MQPGNVRRATDKIFVFALSISGNFYADFIGGAEDRGSARVKPPMPSDAIEIAHGSAAPVKPGDLAVTYAHAAIASMLWHAIRPTPLHFSVWYDYHSGEHPMVRRVLETYLSNGRLIDERLIHDMYERFYRYSTELPSMLEASRHIQDTLQDVVGQITEAGGSATGYGATLRRFSAAAAADPCGLPGLLPPLLEETEQLAQRCTTLGRQLSLSGERIGALERALAEARREATTDMLTGLPNRRAFDEQLRRAAGQAMRSGEPLALLIADIDRFKAINDTWGHPVGDAVLRRVAQTIQACLTDPGQAARLGGEEFSALLPGTPLEAARQMAERIRLAVSEKSFSVRSTGKELGAVTISIGVALYHPGESLPCFVERADAALYRAKQAGRNRVACLPCDA